MVSFSSVAVIAVVALISPLTVAFTGLRLPEIVVEILLGIVVGPQVLGWASNDERVQVLSLIGLAFLLLLAGLEIDFNRLRGRLLRLTGLGYAVSFGLALFVVLASRFGLEAILGAFLAGATLKLVDRDQGMTHAFFHAKLEAVGFGVFVPFFFVSTGIKLDVASLFHGGSTIARVPIFL